MFNEYPSTNFHELNADWMLKQIKKDKDLVEGFENRLDELEEHLGNDYYTKNEISNTGIPKVVTPTIQGNSVDVLSSTGVNVVASDGNLSNIAQNGYINDIAKNINIQANDATHIGTSELDIAASDEIRVQGEAGISLASDYSDIDARAFNNVTLEAKNNQASLIGKEQVYVTSRDNDVNVRGSKDVEVSAGNNLSLVGQTATINSDDSTRVISDTAVSASAPVVNIGATNTVNISGANGVDIIGGSGDNIGDVAVGMDGNIAINGKSEVTIDSADITLTGTNSVNSNVLTVGGVTGKKIRMYSNAIDDGVIVSGDKKVNISANDDGETSRITLDDKVTLTGDFIVADSDNMVVSEDTFDITIRNDEKFDGRVVVNENGVSVYSDEEIFLGGQNNAIRLFSNDDDTSHITINSTDSVDIVSDSSSVNISANDGDSNIHIDSDIDIIAYNGITITSDNSTVLDNQQDNASIRIGDGNVTLTGDGNVILTTNGGDVDINPIAGGDVNISTTDGGKAYYNGAEIATVGGASGGYSETVLWTSDRIYNGTGSMTFNIDSDYDEYIVEFYTFTDTATASRSRYMSSERVIKPSGSAYTYCMARTYINTGSAIISCVRSISFSVSVGIIVSVQACTTLPDHTSTSAPMWFLEPYRIIGVKRG